MKKQAKKKEHEKACEQPKNHCFCDSRDYSTPMIWCDYCTVWYHYECVQVTDTEANLIKKFACKFCTEKDSNCVIVYKKWAKGVKMEKKKNGKSEKKKETISYTKVGGKEKDNGTMGKSAEKRREQEEDEPKQSVTITAEQKHQLELQETNPNLRCKKCFGCSLEKNCGKCFTCAKNDGKCCMDRICVQVEELLKQQQKWDKATNGEKVEEEGIESQEIGQKKSKKGRKPKAKTEEMRLKKHRQNVEAQRKHAADEASINAQLRKAYENSVKRQRRNGNVDQTTGNFDDMQCYGPSCTNSARIGSKYCSDNCGVAMAKLRLNLILPQRFNAYFGDPPHSQTENNEQMQRIQQQMADINVKLDELEQWKNNMHQFIVVLKSNEPTNVEKKANDDENMLVGCPVCHSEFQMREVCKHIQTCFVRSERQTTYGTDYQIPNNQYNLYCEAFNKIDGTYCKRLRYACAEHYRDEYGLEICGCPLNWCKGSSLEFREMFLARNDTSFDVEGFCREKLKNCRDHKNWAQTAFSLIDNDRLNLLNKFDELCEQQRHLQMKLLQRGDILSLMCNDTTDF